MGIRERIVFELICDLCGKEIEGEPGRTGSLEARTTGARGRGERHVVWFHEACYARLVGLATKPAATRRRRASAAPTPSPDGGPAKTTGRRKATAGRPGGRRRRESAEASQSAS